MQLKLYYDTISRQSDWQKLTSLTTHFVAESVGKQPQTFSVGMQNGTYPGKGMWHYLVTYAYDKESLLDQTVVRLL